MQLKREICTGWRDLQEVTQFNRTCKELNEKYVLRVQLGKFCPSKELWPHPRSQSFPRANSFANHAVIFLSFLFIFLFIVPHENSCFYKTSVFRIPLKIKTLKGNDLCPCNLSLEGNIKFTLFSQEHGESIVDMYPSI